MEDVDQSQSNLWLVLMRLDLSDPNPFYGRGALEPGKEYHLLAAVLDPAQRATSAPIAGIKLTDGKFQLYNHIIARFQEVSARFYGRGGFIDRPETYTDERQNSVTEDIGSIGRSIYALLQTPPNPVAVWLSKLLTPDSVEGRRFQSVTIITNDFGIPWFWMNCARFSPLLCDVCSLGMLQLSAAGRPTESHETSPGRRDKTYDALLIKGSTDLPFIDEELRSIESLLEGPDRWAVRLFKSHRVAGRDDIPIVNPKSNSFRIVHFSGHYTGDQLLLGGHALPIAFLKDVVSGSLLVLDGCSSARELGAWTDVAGLTSDLINQGALGCVVTVLPVKHDPIVNRILWENFYQDLRRGTGTVGHALARARNALHDHFVAVGSSSPSWAAYQLIGSPAVRFCDGEDEGHD